MRSWRRPAGTWPATVSGAPRVRVLVGVERHETVDLALRYLGLGVPEPVAADDQGRIRTDALAEALGAATGPTIVCLQAGNLHSGDFDPFGEAVALAHARGAWVHVDGAFGLWAAASSRLRHLVTGVERADSWATDAHKTLNVPYDCGVVIVRDPAAMRAEMGMHGDYLLADEQYGDPHERVPELSRRGRAFPVWALLRALGRSGVAELVDGLVFHARALANGLRAVDRGRGAQRGGLHPGLRRIRLRRAHPRGREGADGRRDHVDDRVALARPGRASHLGEQLVHRRG